MPGSIRRNNLDGATEQKIENEIEEIARTLIKYGFVCQNKDFGFFLDVMEKLWRVFRG